MTDDILEHVENKTVLTLVVELIKVSASLFEINKHVVIIFCNGCVPSLFRAVPSDSLYASSSFLINLAYVTWYVSIVSNIRLEDPSLIKRLFMWNFLFARLQAGVLTKKTPED